MSQGCDTMKTLSAFMLLFALASGCARLGPATGDGVLPLPPGAILKVRESGTNGVLILLGNVNGVVSFTPLLPGGYCPVSVNISNGQPTQIVRELRTTTNKVELYDRDGDGLVDIMAIHDNLGLPRFGGHPGDECRADV